MEKHSINLLIQVEKEPLILGRLKIFLPVLAVISLPVFIVLLVLSLNYVNNNIAQYNRLKAQVDQLEQRITAKKSTEGLYTLTAKKLDVLDKLLSKNKNFIKPVTEITNMRSEMLDISEISAENDNTLSFSVAASSSAVLDNLISMLLLKEANQNFSNIQASNILRDRGGKYTFRISLKANPSLFK